MMSGVWTVGALLLATSCRPQRHVVAPMPPRPTSLQETVGWPYASYDGSPTQVWCEYACGPFLRSEERVHRCRRVLLSYELQQSLGTDGGIACEFD
jgi:hypothetical protein